MSHSQPPANQLPMGVANVGFLVDRLGKDCAPLQQIRELTQNAIEAIQEAGGVGEIVWDIDKAYYQEEKVNKLCIVDNGKGMTHQDLFDYINNLSSSSHEQSMSENYGLGAKIAAVTRNPWGILYQSWKNGLGSAIHLYKDGKSGTYGLKQFESSENEFSHWIELEDAVKPITIKNKGTKVTLLGESADHDTSVPPEGTPMPSNWLNRYLNTRYFSIPEGIILQGSAYWGTPHYSRSQILGQKHFLNEKKVSSGTVQLAKAKAHWWILSDEKANRRDHGDFAVNGHVAALYQNELYEMTSGRSSTARLQSFGVVFGYRRVMIYVEPEGNHLTTNTARTMILRNNQPLPWEEWGAEFKEKMPVEIDDLMQEDYKKVDGKSHTEAIQERLKKLGPLYSVSRYKPTEKATLQLAPDTNVIEESLVTKPEVIPDPTLLPGIEDLTNDLPPLDDDVERERERRKPKDKTELRSSVLSRFRKKGETKMKKMSTADFPKVVWISVQDDTRPQGELEDRAAHYIKTEHMVQANADFRIIGDLIKVIMEERKLSGRNARNVVEDAVKAWFEQSFVETVVGVLALSNSKYWNPADIERGLSDESLTATVMQKYHVYTSAKRDIGNKLGIAKEDKVVEDEE